MSIFKVVFFFAVCFFSHQVYADFEKITEDKPYIVIDSIVVKGNHVTKEYIIFRELLFSTKDTVFLDDYKHFFSRSIDNLNNTSLFNFVFIDTNATLINKIVTITVVERWYLWPFPYFSLSERNFNTWWETKDLNKINYGLYFVKENFRGRREDLKFIVRRGFEETYGISYSKPYIDKNQTFGIGFSFGLSRNKEVPYLIDNNKQLYFRVNDYYIRENVYATLQLNYRKNFNKTHSVWLSYNSLTFADTLIKQNDFFSKDGMKNNKYFTVNYFYKDDHRDFRAYPLNGYFFTFDVNKFGLNLLNNEAANVFFVRAEYRKYSKISDALYFAFSNKIKYANYGFQPFYIKRGLGYGNDYVRGYDYYVVDGISYWISKNNLKYEVLAPRTKKIKFIKSEKFNMIHYALYANLFFDCGYAYEYKRTYNPSNDLSDTFLYGYGAGLDLVTYYDKVLRVEYAFNRMKERGFFFNFVAPL